MDLPHRPFLFVLATLAAWSERCAHLPATEALAVSAPPVVLPADPGAYTGAGLVWQGVDLQWRYNHRVNRLGALVEQASCGLDVGERDVHCPARLLVAAASGTGPDVADVRAEAALVRAAGIAFSSATGRLRLQGREGEALVARRVLDVPVDAHLGSRAQRFALLNGFDLSSLETADKLLDLEIRVGVPEPGPGGLRVPVEARARLACSTPECPRRDTVAYDLTVAVVVLGGDEDVLRSRPEAFADTVTWTRRLRDRPDVAEPAPEASSSTGFLGVRGLALHLDREHHVLRLGLSVRPSVQDGQVQPAHATFEAWRPRMRDPRRPLSLVARRDEGRAGFELDLVAFEVPHGDVREHDARAHVDWQGWGRRSTSPDASRSFPVDLVLAR